MQFTVVVDNELFATDGFGRPLLAVDRGADRLAAALARSGHEATVVEGALATIAADAWLLYFGADPALALARTRRRRAVLKRLVLIDHDRVDARELVEELDVPFAVTSRSFRNWLDGERASAQVFGRVRLARELGALDPYDAHARYTMFSLRDEPLPDGIARCCGVLERGPRLPVARLVSGGGGSRTRR
ncbi:MAG TPA: hypothetical protein VFQ53_03650 [Kofleriaceae bacterium]|nr:hypothetical protein [Kofleriaceae bacterium]